MEKRSHRRVPDLVARPAFQGLSENEIGRARISMMARNTSVPLKGRIQKRKTNRLQIVKSDLQRTAGPYSRAKTRHQMGARQGSSPHPFTWARRGARPDDPVI